MYHIRSLHVTVLVIVIAFSGQPRAAAQDVWSLERCINYALDNNIMIRQQELNTQVSENALLQARMNRLPSLNANTQQSFNYGRTLDFATNIYEDQNTRSFSYNASSQVTLFNGFQVTNTIRQNDLNLMAALADLERLQNDISLNIASAYLQILFNKELLSIARSQLEITRQQVDRTRRLVEAGSLPRGNLLEIEAQEASDNLRVVNANNQLVLSYLTLTQLLELPSPDDFVIEVPDFDGVPVITPQYEVDPVFEAALETQPQIRSAEYELASSEAGLSIAKGRRSPRLFLSGSYGSGYQEIVTGPWADREADSFEDQIRNNQRTTFSLGLSIPIFNAWQVNTAISNAQIGVINAGYSMQRTKNELFQRIQQAYADVVAAHENFLATEKALTSIEESFRHMEQRFEVGMVTTVEFNQALNQLGNTRSDLLRAKYEYIFKTNILEFYMGNPITL
ncbi:MAG: TolC family protein [Marinilabiliales bacterium]|nr:MAG: TolC family protein [Marinilabiliales bacterium]